MRVGAALFLCTGVARPECLSMRAARVKIISTGKATCYRKRNRRVLPYWLSQSFPDCADETEREPQRQMQPSPGRWGRRAETAVSDIRDIGSSGCARGRSLLPNPRPRVAAHLRHGSPLQPPARALTPAAPRRPDHPGPPRGHPQPRKGQTVPESDVAGWSGAQRKGGGNVRGDARPPRTRGHPKGESRKNDRETRKGWRREAKYSRTGLLGAAFPNRLGSSQITILKLIPTHRPGLDSKKEVSARLTAGSRPFAPR